MFLFYLGFAVFSLVVSFFSGLKIWISEIILFSRRDSKMRFPNKMMNLRFKILTLKILMKFIILWMKPFNYGY